MIKGLINSYSQKIVAAMVLLQKYPMCFLTASQLLSRPYQRQAVLVAEKKDQQDG